MKKLILLLTLFPLPAFAECDPFPDQGMGGAYHSCNYGRGGALFALPPSQGWGGNMFYGGRNLYRDLNLNPQQNYPVRRPPNYFYQRWIGPQPRYE